MRVYSKLSKPALLLWATGCVRLYKDGAGFNGVLSAWHPVTWLMLTAMIVPCAVAGEKLTQVVPLRLPAFWVRNKAQLQWVSPFSRLESLVPFKFSALVPG